MQEIDKIIRAWKDDDYRMSLSIDEQKALPANPAGSIEVPVTAGLNQSAGWFYTLSGVIISCCLV